MPLPSRGLSSLLLRIEGRMLLFDCGEGTQVGLKRLGVGFKTLDAIFISHLHADHVSGLVGILLMLANSGRDERVHLYGPPRTATIVAGQRLLARHLPYELRVVELWSGESVEAAGVTVTCVEGQHSTMCLAYRIDLDRRPRFDADRARALGLPVQLWHVLQDGQAVEHDGRTVEPVEVLGSKRRGLSVAYVTDTRPTDPIVSLARGVDLLVSEGTFGDSEDQPRAVETGHMTFAEAARLAVKTGARRLLLTHFSPSLSDPLLFAHNARDVFPDAIIGSDGFQMTLRYAED
jgi:ribonuclease Z